LESYVLSAALNQEAEWNYRITEQRLIEVKTKNADARKAAVRDVLTNLLFTVQVSDAVDIEELVTGQEYLANLNVYTSKNVDDVEKDFLGFFEALDIDQSFEDFIKAYWVYPRKIRFQLNEAEKA
jgi:hypothetical protein